ncbi:MULTISPECIES: cation diffusion facilitator family transporter [Shouchella]|uniref:Cadmium, cobalt and zinc/H(+)-K(+) antiporter n=3 Tax=Bacillaceae TaxID=186817 RepID=A0A060LYZ4_9BACI|nr:MULTISPECIES: cation diffusion facilitator family transporter [Bacillaceae]RQW19052.1 cation transporter [Bacillus sp. C1-1]AIC96471.1 Cadmium, cobalt and zinc/H(+)-K(+) antiporter [Shouchella lehensis G1]KQL57329.1 zinc transporter ZitB [Alkalicoccobacillus plakortidis]MBG9785320.1 zinc transporter ZitB [Shouchella lehensis]TES46766.1 cation transporter [Shouchella lehensis]
MGHHHGHSHHHSTGQANKRNLLFAMLIIGSWMFIQFIGGLWTGSLALLADAVHMFNDFANLFISFLAITLAAKAATKTRTFGNHRYEVLSSLLNSVMLLVIAFFIVREAIGRFIEPEAVMGGGMIILAFIGLLANLGAMYVLMRGDVKNNLNMRGAYLHVLSDTLGSVAAVIAGIIILTTGWYLADPILSILIAFMIALSAIRLLKDTIHVLMEGTPSHIDIDEVNAELRSIDGVKRVHDLHIWTITSGMDRLSAHVIIDADRKIDSQDVLMHANDYFRKKLHIENTTIQIERE